MLFESSDIPERELKLQNVQLLGQWTQSFFRELRGEFRSNDNRKLCINRNTHRKQEWNQFGKNMSKSIIFYDFKQNRFGRTFIVENGQCDEFTVAANVKSKVK